MAAKLLTLPAGRLTRQPAGPCGIDWGNPITRDLLVAFDGRTAREMVRPARFSGAGATTPTKVGLGYEVAGGSSVAQLAGRTLASTAVTAFILLNHATAPSRYAGLVGRGTYSSGSGNSADFSLDSGTLRCYSVSAGGGSGSLGSAASAGLHSYTIASTGTALTAYVDGVQSGTDTYMWGLETSAETWLVGATSTDLASTEYMPGTYLLALVWNRELSAQEIRSLHLNPWQVFREQPRILLIPASGSPPQLLAPVSDVSAGGWTASSGSDLYAMLDESAYSDADYIVSSTASACTMAFSSGSDPAVSTGHVLRYRLLAGSGSITATLKQGSTTIASWGPHTLTGAAQDFAQTLSAGEADSITDYSALRVEFTADYA